MNCPVCGKEAKAHIYFCAEHGVYVHEKCWRRHESQQHAEEASAAPVKRRR